MLQQETFTRQEHPAAGRLTLPLIEELVLLFWSRSSDREPSRPGGTLVMVHGVRTVPIVPVVVVPPRNSGADHTKEYQQQKSYPILLHAVEEHGDWTPVTSHGMVPWSGPDRGLSNTDRTPVHGSKPVTHTHTHLG